MTDFWAQTKVNLINEIKLNIRYGLAGILNGFVGVGAIWILTMIGIAPIAANFIGFSAGVAFAFLVARKFVFKSDDHVTSESIRYMSAFGVCYLINIAMLQMCVSVFLLDAMTSQGMAVSSYVISMYLASRFFIFRRKKA